MSTARPRAGFGVGCFYFSPKGPVPTDNQTAWYRNAVRQGLELIPNTNNVSVEGGDDPDLSLLPVERRQWPSLRRFRSFTAHPSYVEIEFDLYIPVRIQRQLLNGRLQEPLPAEHFHVFVYHGDMPIAIVRQIGGENDIDPSGAVVVVREYLTEQLAVGDLELSYLGPSPFHGDFFAEAEREQIHRLRVSRERQPGYARYICKYQPARMEDIADAMHCVMLELSDELSIFYEIHRIRRVQIADWHRIHSAVRSSRRDERR